VLIRDARPDEFAELGEIRVAAYLADGFLSPDSQYAPRLRSLGADRLDPVLVAVRGDTDRGGDMLGTVMLQRWPQGGELLTGPDEAEIRALAVAPGAQGGGVGRALLRAVIERAGHEGVRHLLLLTQTEMKAAHHLYEEAGFSRLPERDRYPEPGFALLAYGLPLEVAAGAGRPSKHSTA
jgi:ribosomal protein S18 acetylase RimI-like enzyme